ncbi:hypothetical protein [Staphylococcus equorum]|uniref:hypothetical protein n=2 Tax=Staphylococcus TaxID=1279 RepID=UPI0020CCCD0C|nr:hypothetical protein [Staphylococcus equorum]UTT55145.1 hypothetical protein NMQ06_08380 [Staphylococcus equorum]UTT55206.1 hypothetical protein NMQ06_08695 [Staphylococcus equorum]
MARKEITTPLDLKNLENHNENYDELYGLIDETDRRISEDMWEEIKDANTMKMLEPVQTAAELPSEAADKSLITVIDEQRVYVFVNGEWQPFSEIDLDPFEPFKDELAAIVAAYEKQIQSITTEVQNTKTSAIDSIQSTQTQSEASITQTKQSANDSINQTQTEAESNIGAIRDEMSTQASELTALFNDSMDKLTSKQDTALAEVDSAKQAAITALEDFNNTDTSNWQKYKLTDEKGASETIGLNNDIEQLHSLPNGRFYTTSTPIEMASSSAGFTTVEERDSYSGLRRIEFRPYNSTQKFVKRLYDTWSDWEPVEGSQIILYEGGVSGVGSKFNLNDDPSKYTYLVVYGTNGDGTYISPAAPYIDGHFFAKDLSIFAGADGAMLYEIECHQGATPTEYEIFNSLFYRIHTDESAESATASITKIVGVK